LSSPDAPRLLAPSPPLDRHHPDPCLRRRRKPQRRTSRPRRRRRRRQNPRTPVHQRSDQHHGTNQRRPDQPSRSPPPECFTVNPPPLATRTLRPNSSPRTPTLIPTAQAARAHSARTLFQTWTRQGRAFGKSRSSSRTYRARPTLFQGSWGCPVHRMSSDHQHRKTFGVSVCGVGTRQQAGLPRRPTTTLHPPPRLRPRRATSTMTAS